MRTPLLIATIALSVTSTVSAQASRVSLPGSNVMWDIDARSAKVDTWLGRPALFLRNQAPPALAADVDFADGTIEFDIAPMPAANFVGLVFRYASGTEHENIYFRLHKSGGFEAMQYAPRLYTAAGIWQLTPEFMSSVAYTPTGWLHIRAVLTGSRLEIFVADSAKPTLIVPRMRGLHATGRVGFWGRVNDKPGEWTAALSNIRITRRPPAALATEPDTSSLPSGTLTGWKAAGPFAAADSSRPPTFPSPGEWTPLPIEEHGLLNISRHYPKPPGGRHVVFLRNTIAATASQIVALDVSYSDDAMFWLNGVPVFRGSNAFNARYPGYLGLTGITSETIYLPLGPGDNELVVAVGERAFGWGLRARIVR